MNTKNPKKNIDYSKINIGTELECFIVNASTFNNATPEESQKIFQGLIEKFDWEIKEKSFGEIHYITREIFNCPMEIGYDTSYSIIEIGMVWPVDSLERMEEIHKEVLCELRAVLKANDLIIWPFGVAPSSTNLLKTSNKTSEKIVNDSFYGIVKRWDYLERLCHITSHQVNIDIPFLKLLPAINAFYKNLGSIIERFSNSSVYANGMLYKEGRYYWWLDANPNLKRWRIPEFPENEFQNWNQFFEWVFEKSGFVIRNGKPCGFKYGSTFCHGPLVSIKDFLSQRKVIAIDPEGKDMELEMEKDDINMIFHMTWIDFKPHFEFDQRYTLEEFMHFYKTGDIEGFLKKYCRHCWLEIRPCSPHFEDNAMVIPRYFYNIVKNLDKYIEDSKKISWEEAKKAREKAIGYIN